VPGLTEFTNEQLLSVLSERLAGDAYNPDKEAGKELARQFAKLYDEQQADFFEEVARIFDTWGFNGPGQTYAIARHMNTCACVTALGRGWVRELAEHLDKP